MELKEIIVAGLGASALWYGINRWKSSNQVAEPENLDAIAEQNTESDLATPDRFWAEYNRFTIKEKPVRKTTGNYYISTQGDLCYLLKSGEVLVDAEGFNIDKEVDLEGYHSAWKTESGQYITKLGAMLYFIDSDGKILTKGSHSIIKGTDGKIMQTTGAWSTFDTKTYASYVAEIVKKAESDRVSDIRALQALAGENNFTGVSIAFLAHQVIEGYLRIERDRQGEPQLYSTAVMALR